ncbi:hypothetical protein ACFLZJ_01270 [Nanoarchaeota archaeon]
MVKGVVDTLKTLGAYFLIGKGLGWIAGVNFLGDMSYGVLGDTFIYDFLENINLSTRTITDLASGYLGQEVGGWAVLLSSPFLSDERDLTDKLYS